MSKPFVKFHNVETNQVIEREMTDEEFEDYQLAQKTYLAEEIAANKIAEDKAALLAKLGITDDEAKLLLS